MNKIQFKDLFLRNLQKAITKAEHFFHKTIPNSTPIEIYGSGFSGKIVSTDDAIDIMYIDDITFYRIIDIGVVKNHENNLRIFVRISAHPTSMFENTWNTPVGNGPFKVLEPLLPETQIRVE